MEAKSPLSQREKAGTTTFILINVLKSDILLGYENILLNIKGFLRDSVVTLDLGVLIRPHWQFHQSHYHQNRTQKWQTSPRSRSLGKGEVVIQTNLWASREGGKTSLAAPPGCP